MAKLGISEEQYQKAAERLNVELATIKAVAEVESRGSGFINKIEPKILFERHIFHLLTNGKFSKDHPDISNISVGGWGKEIDQHKRLQKAAALDRDAALQSASWGRFQILGKNWKKLGYDSLQHFINDMYESENKHLESFVRYVEAFNLARFLRWKKWASFARGYNGVNYKMNKYDEQLANAYQRYK